MKSDLKRLSFFSVLACLVMAGCFHGWRGLGGPKSEAVEAEGWAAIDPVHPLETRRRALAEAQKKAVEKAAGVSLSAVTKVEAAVTSEEKIVANVGGYVEKYDVLSEKSEDGFLKIRIRARVLLSLADGYDQVAAGLSRSLPEGRMKIAIARFPYVDGRFSDGSRAVQEALTTRLAGRSLFQVVDTSEAERSGAAASDRMPGVDAVLTGSLADLPHGRVQIMARLVRQQDGVILSAVEGSVERTWEDPLATARPASVGEWIDSLLSPPASAFHRQEDISKAMQAGLDSLKEASDPRPASPKPGIVSASPGRAGAELARGRRLYEQDCVQCHGIGGKGSSTVAAMFNLPPATLDLSRRSVKECSPESLARDLKGGKQPMPEIQRALSREDICALLEYLRSFQE